MKATELLTKQHEEVHDLLAGLATCGVEERTALVGRLAAALRGHAMIEEELFYPVLEEEEPTRDLIEEAFQEHDEMKTALAELERCNAEDEEFPDLVEELQGIVEHHVEEEQGELFPKVEKLWTADMLERVGADMEQRYAEVSKGEEARAF